MTNTLVCLTGAKLLVAIGRSPHTMQLRDGATIVHLSQKEALAVVKDGSSFVGYGGKRNIRELRYVPAPVETAHCQIRSLPCRPKQAPRRTFGNPLWRVAESAVLPPSIDWLLTRLNGVRELMA